MKKTTKLTPVSQLGEFGLIEHLTHKEQTNKNTIKGIGDDAAVIAPTQGMQTVITTDLLIEGIHFDLMYVPLKHLGYKAVVVNLSDVYAMNALPKQITVSIAISSRFTVEALEELYDGIYTACKVYGIDLIGGDTSAAHKGMHISVTAIGEQQPEKIVYRNTAKLGNSIWVSGDLGAAYLGLQLLEREKQLYLEDSAIKPDLEEQSYLVGRQLKPEPRRDIIEILEGYNILPSAMIDISDGLSSDLLHICHQSEVGCELYENNLPFHPDTIAMAQRFNISPIGCALSGGEDYELLFTTPPEAANKLKGTVGITEIGKIVAASEGRSLITKAGKKHPLTAQGWQHYPSKK